MKRLAMATAGLLVMLAAETTAEARAEFDPAENGLRLPSGVLRTYGFESAEGLVGLELTSWAKSGAFFPSLERTPIASAEGAAALLTGAVDAIEGAHAVRLKGGAGLAIVDPAIFAAVREGKVEVSLWIRADGIAPSVHVVYDQDPANVFAGGVSFAQLRAVRTGRETTDGWVELSTGAIDGSVWGAPIRAVVIAPHSNADSNSAFLVDAVEIEAVPGEPVQPTKCTQQNIDAVCGAGGDCMFGRCVSSTVTWGVLPSPAHRAEIAERWVHFGTRVMGDRNAVRNGAEILAPGARALAESATSSRQFFGGLTRFVNLLRDNHTSFGSPGNYTNFQPQVHRSSSSALGACFGVLEKDIMGGGLAYGVFRAVDTPLTGVPLQRGDVVIAIDGRDPKEWVDVMWPRFAATLPNDPSSDWGPSANALSRLVTTRATTITLQRCASAAACTGPDRKTFTIDIAEAAYKAIVGGTQNTSPPFSCSQRFLDSVAELASSAGEDPVSIEPGPDGETRVQFDGFVGQDGWRSRMTGVFSPRPQRVLMDTRMGHGGYYTTVEHLFHLLRGTSEPIGVFAAGRGAYAMTDPPWLLDRLGSCTDERGGEMWSCFAGNANGFFTREADPPGAATKIAWLNTYDVSANDFMPKLLAGRSNVRIFAPHPTSGAFGSVSSLPPLAAGWSGGSIQVQDARFAPDLASVADARWESGHGVPPDTLVVQKLSDAIEGRDTIVLSATAWLATP
jgi:hypothetical protein